MKARVLLVCFGLSGLGAAGADQVELTYEVFSMPLPDAATLMRQKVGGEEAYHRVLTGMEEKRWRQEQLMVLKAEEEAAMTSEEIEEVIFPTEYDPPELPSTIPKELRSAPPQLLPVPPVPTSFEWKHEGWMVEAEAGKVGDRWRVVTRLTRVGLVQRDPLGRGPGMVEMPRFSAQGLVGSFLVTARKPALLGTISPPRELQGDRTKQIWLVFLTARESR